MISRSDWEPLPTPTLSLCVLQGRIGRPMAFSSRFLGHWPKDGPAALADGREIGEKILDSSL